MTRVVSQWMFCRVCWYICNLLRVSKLPLSFAKLVSLCFSQYLVLGGLFVFYVCVLVLCYDRCSHPNPNTTQPIIILQAFPVFASRFFELQPEGRQYHNDICGTPDNASLGQKNPIGMLERDEYHGVSF